MLTAITGVNWGDEGKGRIVDLLGARCDYVVRYQGGNNAGHTVVNDAGKFILNLLPSGILRPEVVNVMGPGMVIDLAHLCGEIDRLRAAGVSITPDNLRISARAHICMPYHVTQDILEEERLGAKKFGSTRRGIAPVYGDKYMKKGLRMEDLSDWDALSERVGEILDWKNEVLSGTYHCAPFASADLLGWLEQYGLPLLPYLCDTGALLETAHAQGKNILFEAQLGALRDVEFGIYPYTSSSLTLAAYAPIGAGVPGLRLDRSIGVMKAYSTCVGEGPFTAEMFGQEAEALRQAGGEYGAATGRPRRVGSFDAVASRYGASLQGCDEIALTKLDVLSDLARIPICVAYRIDGRITRNFPDGPALTRATPVIETVPGWGCDISGCRNQRDLPPAAVAYIKTLERLVERPIRMVSVGAEREAYLNWED